MPSAQVFQLVERQQGWLARGSIKLLIALQILLTVLILTGAYVAANHLRQTSLNNMQEHSRLQAHNLAEHITQNLELLYLHLTALVADNPATATDKDALRNALLQLQPKLNFIRFISVIDDEGTIVVSTLRKNEQQKIRLGALLPDAPSASIDLLRFGGPWQGRDFVTGTPFQELNGQPIYDSGFFPVTLILPEIRSLTFVVAINSDFFINQAATQEDEANLTYRMLLDDGTLLFSTATREHPGSQPLTAEHLQQVLREHSGMARWQNQRGNLQLSAFRTSKHYPFFIHAQTSEQHVLRQWKQSSRLLWLLALGTLSIMLATGALLTRRVQRTLHQEELNLEKNQLAAIVFLHSNDLISIADSKHRLIAVNPAYEQATGYPATELLGKTPEELHSENANDNYYQQLWQHLETHDSWFGEQIKTHKDGHTLSGHLQVNAIRDATGKTHHYVAVFKDLSRLHEHEVTIHKLSMAMEQSPSSIVMTDPDAHIEYANPEFLAATGYTRDEVIGVNPRILQSGKTPALVYQEMWQKISSGQVWHGEFVNKRKNGEFYWERASISPILDQQGEITGYLGIKHDITAEKQAEQAMRLAASVMSNTSEGIMICDAQERIIEVNPAFTQLTGFSNSEVLGLHPNVLGAGERNQESLDNMRAALKAHSQWQGEFWNRHKDGSLYVVHASVSLIHDEKGELTHFVALLSDITESKQQQEHLKKQAYFDPLTELPNRVLLEDRLNQAIASAQRHAHWLAICFMDLDGFKQVNDTHGHQAGDELLVCIAQRLKNSLRADDTIARLGGDEFILLLSPVKDLAECKLITKRVLDSVALPIQLDSGHEVQVTGSMGITLYPQDNSAADQLLRHADHAMYEAKKGGRNRYVISSKIT